MKKTFTKTDLHQKKKISKISPHPFLQSNLYSANKPSGD